MNERSRRWRRLDVPAIEDFREDERTFRGRVVVQEAVPWSVEYAVSFDDRWVTSSAEVTVRLAADLRRLALQHDGRGRWFDGNGEVEGCRGALDVDLGLTPSTNTSAIRRLALTVGDSAELVAAWVRFPELSVEPLRQRYTRLGDREYLYQSLRDGAVVFEARLEVDATGLVERYERLFERVDPPA